MSRRRELLSPNDAKTEGARRLRELILHTPIVRLARKLRCDESAIRHYARERRLPDEGMRRRLREVFGWAEDVWNRPPDVDVPEPATTRIPDGQRPSRIRTARPTS